MQIQLLRHATLVVRAGTATFIVDPMLSPVGAMAPVSNAADDRPIPLVPLPLDREALKALLASVDAVLLTHTHRDHWDEESQALLSRDLPVFCQPADVLRVRHAGFGRTLAVADSLVWHGVRITRTGGRHGTADVGRQMGSVSGYLLDAPGEPRLYLAGDTIWCDKVQSALARWRPRVIVVNAGAAQFITGGPITMNAEDVVRTTEAAPADAAVVAVHFEAVNHCRLTRAALMRHLEAAGMSGRVMVPLDGETLSFA
jgi:L-ascorbate metabolism protein UlaG (beta-lactamase superfamily)